MATRFHIGSKELRGALSAYAKRFDLLEVIVARETKAKGGTVPAVATLRRWRKEVPPHFNFAVVAGPELSLLKPSTIYEEELAGARAAMDALQARCFVLRTPPEVRPTALARQRLKKVLEPFPRDVGVVVWEPSGIWDVGEAAVVAKELDVVLAVDAARDPVPAGPVAYVRLRAMGETRSFGPAALERIARSIGQRRDVFVILETDSALDEAKRLRQIAQKAKARKEGGTSRLVRPRGGIMVRDDEQE
jgi:uncharacterized protein YecE (DUF72 family)